MDADCGRRTQRKHPLARATSCPERLELQCPAKVKLGLSQYNIEDTLISNFKAKNKTPVLQ